MRINDKSIMLQNHSGAAQFLCSRDHCVKKLPFILFQNPEHASLSPYTSDKP